jgi:hypothetical protein
LDTAETVGAALEAVTDGRAVRPVAAEAAVPYTTARGWVRRLGVNGVRLAVGFGGLVVELGGDPLVPVEHPGRWAVMAIGAAWRVAVDLVGWAAVGCWRFCSSVCGGSVLAANTNSPWLVVGKRRFMPPVP